MEHSSLTEIALRNLRLHIPLGVYPEEQALGSDVILNVRAWYDATLAATTDRLSHAVDYLRLCEVLCDVAYQNCALAEHLAEKIVIKILSEFEKLQAVEVEVIKLSPPTACPLEAFSVKRYVRR
ncbi:MAG: dihydroneopterin aldolase [Flavobacteriales bacterium]|nr:dihydroneopterin aldolase [Flavobacteriales bacterium]MCX7768744.1 dihydroneopterin aldolase [Flavobacteriales bacterium]MDW8409903.1 dihydroneopterin aldolase [Flavobacteriales bacterium]